MARIVRGGSPRPIERFITSSSDGLNWLKIGDVEKGSKYITMTGERISVKGLDKTREVFPGDFILSNSMSFGRPYILKIRTCIHDGWIAITKLSQNIGKDFLYYALLESSIQAYFVSSAAGTGVRNLNIDIIQRLRLYLPPLPEQKAIASVLSSAQNEVEAVKAKIAQLRVEKKALMQQLLTGKRRLVPEGAAKG